MIVYVQDLFKKIFPAKDDDLWKYPSESAEDRLIGGRSRKANLLLAAHLLPGTGSRCTWCRARTPKVSNPGRETLQPPTIKKRKKEKNVKPAIVQPDPHCTLLLQMRC